MVASSQTINVLRYAALSTGIFYGLYHQSRLTSQAKTQHEQSEYQRKEALILQAKAEWAKKSQSIEKLSNSITASRDPNNPQFDLDVYLQQLARDETMSRI